MRSVRIVLRAALLAAVAVACEADKPVSRFVSRPLVAAPVAAKVDSARPWPSDDKLVVGGRLTSLPLVARGVCPFECCQFGKWTTRDSVDVFASERDSASRLTRLPPDFTIVADSGDLYTVRWGIAILQRQTDVGDYLVAPLDSEEYATPPSLVLNRGDTVVRMGHAPESGEILLIHGRPYIGSEFWYRKQDLKAAPELAQLPALLVQEARDEWWVHVKFGGRSGWVDAYHSSIGGKDACE